ncbi:MAG TPA: VOC family protein [Methylomirabilota bacterium]
MRSVLFDHIAIAVPRLGDAETILAGELGGRSAYGMTRDAFRFRHWRYQGGGDIEVLEPAGAADGFLHRFLAQRGPGIHHVTFTVPSLVEACERARAHGYSIVGYDDSDPEWKEAFLHPRQAQGIVVQFAEPDWNRPPSSHDGYGWSPERRETVAPITVLGLRVSARSRERALAQWGTVIQGTPADGADGTLVFRWPGSFMYIAVDIDAAREEGPLWIEYSAQRAVALTDRDPHPVLGAVFTRRPAD